jgi:hypothetical protein
MAGGRMDRCRGRHECEVSVGKPVNQDWRTQFATLARKSRDPRLRAYFNFPPVADCRVTDPITPSPTPWPPLSCFRRNCSIIIRLEPPSPSSGFRVRAKSIPTAGWIMVPLALPEFMLMIHDILDRHYLRQEIRVFRSLLFVWFLRIND